MFLNYCSIHVSVSHMEYNCHMFWKYPVPQTKKPGILINIPSISNISIKNLGFRLKY